MFVFFSFVSNSIHSQHFQFTDIAYGTTISLLNSIANEGDKLADIHTNIKHNLRHTDCERLRIFRKGFFHVVCIIRSKSILTAHFLSVTNRKNNNTFYDAFVIPSLISRTSSELGNGRKWKMNSKRYKNHMSSI